MYYLLQTPLKPVFLPKIEIFPEIKGHDNLVCGCYSFIVDLIDGFNGKTLVMVLPLLNRKSVQLIYAILLLVNFLLPVAVPVVYQIMEPAVQGNHSDTLHDLCIA